MEITEYIQRLNKRYKTGISTEHSYRSDLQNLLESIVTDVLVTNEPAHIACGAPDYIITKKNIPIGYIEAKDIGKPLNSKEYKEQFDRYKKSLDNLIITDYINFWLYRDSEFIASIKIACVENGRIVPVTDNFDSFSDLIKDFCTHISQTIKSASKLSKMMAGKARLLANVIENALIQDEFDNKNQVYEAANLTLREQFAAFKNVLIHDITAKDFADIYAQTISYGMFAARLHDPTLENFSRQEAAELIPKSNPFLRKLFQYIAGYDLDDRIKWIVDALADIFRATDVAALLKDFGKATQQNDPIIHFYETFLAEYDPKLRKCRGVFYTPEPVVNFIVRAVDDILKTEFGLKDGLANTSKTKIFVSTQTSDKRSKTGYKQIEQEVHKVQILDPATGTGTFLAEVVKHIYNKNFKAIQGAWSGYVEEHLVPRLNGFELLMASYSMAHLKLDMLLTETGYNPQKDQRFNIYLTNSLEEYHPDTGTLFASWLSSEANEANHIKRDTPVMIVLGNPPYSISSSNKGKWIESLMELYKEGLTERNIQPLSDDYIKFIRYAQFLIEKNNEGILAFITNNSFIDGVIHSAMRKAIIATFEKIYILDLHGSMKRKEVNKDGTPDENVFDIQPRVCISLFIKKNGIRKSINVYDLLGKRQEKYDFCNNKSINNIQWQQLDIDESNYLFKYIDPEIKQSYQSFVSITKLIPFQTSGIKTHNDNILTSFSKKELQIGVETNYDNEEFKSNLIESYAYRPLDNKLLYNNTDLLGRSREKTIFHLKHDNVALIIVRQSQAINTRFFDAAFITKNLTDTNMFRRGGPLIFPIYLYTKVKNQQILDGKQARQPNLNEEILNQIAKKLRLTFTSEKESIKNTFAPIDILDYIYAVLHSPSYREKYKEFLKIDFPRIPYPKDQDTFWKFVRLGGELRQIHLLESSIVEQYITTYPKDGNNSITRRIRQKDFEITDDKKGFGRVWINDEQYFDKVPLIAWEFYIGGYQPAQKWLKDRHGRTLSYEDIMHYQKIIVALTETDRIMKEIDKIEFE